MSPTSKTPAVEIEVGERDVRISNPDRVYFPASGHTKLDLSNYYLSVGSGIGAWTVGTGTGTFGVGTGSWANAGAAIPTAASPTIVTYLMRNSPT